MPNANQIGEFFTKPLNKLDMYDLFRKTVIVHEHDFIEANETQLDHGVDAKGNSLGRYRNFQYKGRYEPVDLELTGAYRGAFHVIAERTEAEIISTDAKEKKLMDKYGDDIQGVNKDFILPHIEGIKNTFGAFIKQGIGL